MNYAHALLLFGHTALPGEWRDAPRPRPHRRSRSPGFGALVDKYEIVGSSIHSVVMLNAAAANRHNYWCAAEPLAAQLEQCFPQLKQLETTFGGLHAQLARFQFDETEFALLLLALVTRASESSHDSTRLVAHRVSSSYLRRSPADE
jgi:hypothetical protein